MSVYTALSHEQMATFAAQYGAVLQRVEPIENGIENSNWFLHLSDGRQCVLTVFEVLDFAAASALASILDGLAAQGLPVAAPRLRQDGERLAWLAEKPAQVAARLHGTHPMQPNLAQCAAMGEGLARLHAALQHRHIQSAPTTATDALTWQQQAMIQRADLDANDQLLFDTLFTTFKCQTDLYSPVPQGFIHGDLFRDNTLFDGDQLSGLLDFSECCMGDYLFDIAISVNDFCSDWPNVQLNAEKQATFLAAYQSVRAFTPAETALLPIYLALAAGRFWLSRLQVAERNVSEGRVSVHVLQKDPNEMRDMLRDRLEVASRAERGTTV